MPGEKVLRFAEIKIRSQFFSEIIKGLKTPITSRIEWTV